MIEEKGGKIGGSVGWASPKEGKGGNTYRRWREEKRIDKRRV